MTKWQIRQATPDDAAAIVAIFNPIIETGRYTAFETTFSVEAERGYIVNQHTRGLFHVAVAPEDGQVVGFQVVDPFADCAFRQSDCPGDLHAPRISHRWYRPQTR